MENNYQGDLADIFRAGNSTTSGELSTAVIGPVADGIWQQQFPTHPIDYSEPSSVQDFGDPFCNLRDPLFHDLNIMPSSSTLFSNNNNNSNNNSKDGTSLFGPKIPQGAEMKGRNIFARMLQISPTTQLAMSSPPPAAAAAAVACSSPSTAALQTPSNVIGALVGNNDAIISSKTCLVENSGGLQISSPRNTGIKRRKSQAKKVVCIPAPAPANSRQGGEVVPSDLWAWRKYGQKPIKGSPYPRGYYRCSSSKGCSARKQVERSRTDPNMLVITYTSEHNHPWPTQRNALAGSTRSSHPNHSKHTTSSSTSKTDIHEQNDQNDNNMTSTSSINNVVVKEEDEVAEQDHHHHQNDIKMRDVEFSKDSYQPILPADSSNQVHEDFFADLVELEADPLNLLFAKTLSADINEVGQKNAFNLYADWSSGNSNKDGNTSNKDLPDT